MPDTASPKACDDALLAGLTVLDMSQGIAGPYCGLLLQQQGARVIKIEPPGGDWSRQMGRSKGGQTAISIACNAGKESVVLDTRTPQGRQALRALAVQADVVIQNFRPGVAARMGADRTELAALRPRQVYVSITGYGSEGPWAQVPALDTTMQAVSGLMHVNRDASGQPRRIGFFLVDLSTGLYAAQNTVAALYRAALTGQGRHVEVSMLGVSAALQSYIILDDAMFAGAESAVFNAPTGLFQAMDGMLYISMLDDAMFVRLASAMGFEDWLQDPTLQTSGGRMPRAAALSERLGQAVALRPLAEWARLFQQHDILFGVVGHPRDLLTHPQAVHAQLFERVTQGPGLQDLPLPVLPGQVGRAAQAMRVPSLGEHTDSVLGEFGLVSMSGK